MFTFAAQLGLEISNRSPAVFNGRTVGLGRRMSFDVALKRVF
jgi:hypothetical protein